MKEIKFRAWHKKNKKLYKVNGIDFNNRYVFCDGKDNIYNDVFRLNEVVIEQYTGMKDKNGKKIYEGDIVKVYYKQWRKDWEGKDKWNYWDNIENIVFINGGFMFHIVVFDTDMYRPMMPMFNNCELNGIEVIGNIHENKGE